MAEKTITGEGHRRFLLITFPRSGSNLLVRILGLMNRPDVLSQPQGGYFFAPPFYLQHSLKLLEKNITEWTDEEKAQARQAYEGSVHKLEEYAKAAETVGKIAFVKEHAPWFVEPIVRNKILFDQPEISEKPWTVQITGTSPNKPSPYSSSNLTIFPDEYLKLWRPIFLIRHPALAFPSNYRAFRDTQGLEIAQEAEGFYLMHNTLRWNRALYDWYTQALGRYDDQTSDSPWPMVVDADDVMTKPEIALDICKAAGLDTSYVQFNWTPATKDDLSTKYSNTMVQRFASTLIASSGIVAGRTSEGLDLGQTKEKWEAEFGLGEAKRMQTWVEAAMPDYEYLRARRILPRST